MGQDLLEQRLTALCFWLFEPRKFNTVINDIAEEMLRVGMKKLSRKCAEASSPQAHFTGTYIPRRERQFCLFITEVFLGPKQRTGRKEFTLFLCVNFADSRV